jgi:hypothetical protein
VINKKPDLKKFYDWPDQGQLLEMTATDTLPEKSKKETKSLSGAEELGSSKK